MNEQPIMLTPKRDRAGKAVQPAILDRRNHERHATRLGGCLRLPDQAMRYCDILDISSNGARIRTAKPLAEAMWVTLNIEQLGRIHAQVVWRKDNLIGLQFAADPRYMTRMLRGVLPDLKAAA